MSKSNVSEAAILDLLFLNTAFAGVGDTSGLQPSAAAGSLYLALHTADPGEAGDQTTNEVAYTSYARVAVARTSGGFTRSSNTVTLVAQANFPQCTAAASVTVTHFSVGTAVSGAGKILYSGTVSPNFGIALNVTPFLGVGTSISED